MQSLNRFRCLSLASPCFGWLASRGSCSKLFIGGLSYDTNETILKDAFGQYGEIIEVKVICDHFTSEDDTHIALKEMDGQSLDGRNIRVTYAHKG
ncbi:hypothetical protein AAG906_009038 [Vitis piasezkii]